MDNAPYVHRRISLPSKGYSTTRYSNVAQYVFYHNDSGKSRYYKHMFVYFCIMFCRKVSAIPKAIVLSAMALICISIEFIIFVTKLYFNILMKVTEVIY